MLLIGEKIRGNLISFFWKAVPVFVKKHDGLIRHIDTGVLGRVVYQRRIWETNVDPLQGWYSPLLPGYWWQDRYRCSTRRLWMQVWLYLCKNRIDKVFFSKSFEKLETRSFVISYFYTFNTLYLWLLIRRNLVEKLWM